MLPHLSFFLHFFVTYFLPYVSFPLRIDPLRFQARYYKRQLNLALVFVFILYCICIVFWLVNACFCRVGFSYFPYQAKRLARENVSKMTCFVSSGTSNHNSINSQLVHYHSLYISDSHDVHPLSRALGTRRCQVSYNAQVSVRPVSRQRRPAGLLLTSGAGSTYCFIAAAAAWHAGHVNFVPSAWRSDTVVCLIVLV